MGGSGRARARLGKESSGPRNVSDRRARVRDRGFQLPMPRRRSIQERDASRASLFGGGGDQTPCQFGILPEGSVVYNAGPTLRIARNTQCRASLLYKCMKTNRIDRDKHPVRSAQHSAVSSTIATSASDQTCGLIRQANDRMKAGDMV